jgi:hypothetical protein
MPQYRSGYDALSDLRVFWGQALYVTLCVRFPLVSRHKVGPLLECAWEAWSDLLTVKASGTAHVYEICPENSIDCEHLKLLLTELLEKCGLSSLSGIAQTQCNTRHPRIPQFKVA